MRYDELPPFLRIEQVQELTQLGRSQVYELTRLWRDTDGAEGIPVVPFGRALRVPTAALLRMALIDPPPSKGDSDAA
ncbi:MAG: hypothetical protein ACR2JU_14160 [Nocardioidaceae bacterium]